MTEPNGTTYVRRPGLKAVAMDGELVMMGLEHGEYYGLRDVAASIWEHLAQPRSLPELCELVSAEYHVTSEGCRADVAGFIDDMRGKNLIAAVE